MKIFKPLKVGVLLLTGLTGMMLSQITFAAAGDLITNTVSVTYDTGSNTGLTDNDTAAFIEDRLINFTVTATSANVNVIPGDVSTDGNPDDDVLTFTVENTGNGTQDFLLAAIDNDADGAGTFNATGVTAFVEDGTTPGFQTAEDTATFIDNLAPTATATVYIIATIPSTGVNDADTSDYRLAVHVADGSAVGQGTQITADDNGRVSPGGTFSGVTFAAGTPNDVADTAGTVATDAQIVFNDPDADGAGTNDTAGNGIALDNATLTIQAATVNITKSVSVVSDPVNGTSNPKAIPGALVEYVITVTNTGSGIASNVDITDDVSAIDVTASTDAYDTGFEACAAAPCGVRVSLDGGTVYSTLTSAADGTTNDAIDASATTTVISVNDLSLGASGGGTDVAVIRFRATVD